MKFRHALFALAIGFVPTKAQAWLQVCNYSGATVDIVVGYKHEGQWLSRGWWNIYPGGCVTPVEGALLNRDYYLYTQSRKRGVSYDNPNTSYGFCVVDKPFRIFGTDNCKGRGYYVRDFNRIDVGDYSDFTYNLR